MIEIATEKHNSVDVSIANSHNTNTAITEKIPQKYTEPKKD